MATESHIRTNYFTGEDKSLVFTILQAPPSTAAQDITGWGLSWMVKARKTDPDLSALLTQTTALGGVVLTTPASGICTVTLTDTDIAALNGGTLYHHELKRTDAGFETVLSFGQFILGQALHIA